VDPVGGLHVIPAVGRYRGGPSLLLHFDGSGTALVDSSPNACSVTAFGSATQSTDQAKFGPASLKVNGGYARTINAALIIGTQDFTYDCWVYANSLSGETYLLDTRYASGNENGIGVGQLNGEPFFYDGNTFIGRNPSLPLLTIGAWHHVEVGRQGSTIYLFLDGVLIATGTGFSNDFVSNNYVIGAVQYYPIGVEPFNGYIDEAHLVIGHCLNTSSFTPPTAPYPPP